MRTETEIETETKTKTISNRRIENQKYFGPGFWILLHRMALICDRKNEIEFFKKFVEYYHISIPCSKCRKHFGIILNMVKIEKYQNLNLKNKKIGLFFWSWLVHKIVNIYLGKNEIDFQYALEIYSSEK